MPRKRRDKAEDTKFLRLSITVPRDLAERVFEHVERPSGVSGAFRKLTSRGLEAIEGDRQAVRA